ARPAPVPRRRDGGGGRAAFVRVARPGSVPRRDRAPLMPKPGLGPVAAGVAARGLMRQARPHTSEATMTTESRVMTRSDRAKRLADRIERGEVVQVGGALMAQEVRAELERRG